MVHVKTQTHNSRTPERLVSAQEMAGMMGVHKSAVLRLHRQKRIPSYPLGHRLVRFDPAAVMAALAKA